MFYLLFGLLLNRGNDAAAHYLFATYSIFGVMAPGLFGFGVGVAIERERGWLALKRVAPMPPGAYLASKMIMAMGFALITYLVLACMAAGLAGIHLAAAQWLLLGVTSVLGVLPFCALGLLVGSRVNASAAPAVINFIYLPMSFLSGLWMPLGMLPPFISQLAPLWPAYHLAQLALGVVGGTSVGTTSGTRRGPSPPSRRSVLPSRGAGWPAAFEHCGGVYNERSHATSIHAFCLPGPVGGVGCAYPGQGFGVIYPSLHARSAPCSPTSLYPVPTP